MKKETQKATVRKSNAGSQPPTDCRACRCADCIEHNHKAIIDRVRHELPTDELICDLSDLFRIFGDTTRTKILFFLLSGEMCVCAIAEMLGMTQSAISHQLRLLKDANLVTNRRDGKTIYYSLSDDHVRLIIANGFDHLIEKREASAHKLPDKD